MSEEEAIDILNRHRAELTALGVKSLQYFGTETTCPAKIEGAHDILVEYAKPVGYFAFLRIKRKLTEILRGPVELVIPCASIPPRREHILIELISEIPTMTRGLTFEAFCKDKNAIKAVLYNLAVIGSVAQNMSPEIISEYPVIPWRELGDMGDIVIQRHIEKEFIWETIQHELPPLLPQLKKIFSDKD